MVVNFNNFKKYIIFCVSFILFLGLVFWLTKPADVKQKTIQLNSLQKELNLKDCLDSKNVPSINNFLALDLTCLANSNTYSFSDILNSKNTLVNFWSYDCAPCMKELPILQKISDKNIPNFQVLTIHLNSNFVMALTQYKLMGLNMNLLGVEDYQILSYFNLPKVIPQSLFINSSGEVVHKSLTPYFDENKLSEEVKRYF